MIKNFFKRFYNRYTLVVVWVSENGITSQHIKFFDLDSAINASLVLRSTQSKHYTCNVYVIGPCGGVV